MNLDGHPDLSSWLRLKLLGWSRPLYLFSEVPADLLCMLSRFSLVSLCNLIDCSPPGSSPWDSPGKNTGVGCHALLRGIFPTQGSNPGLLRLLHLQGFFLFFCFLPLAPPGNPPLICQCPKGSVTLSNRYRLTGEPDPQSSLAGKVHSQAPSREKPGGGCLCARL